MPSWLQLVRWEDGADIAAVALLAWLGIRYLRGNRARSALVGLAVLGAVYAAATALELRLTAALFQGFFAVVVLVIVVVFQEDLRRFFERIGSWRPGRSSGVEEFDNVSLLVRAVSTLAEQRTGALIVLPRNEPLDRHLEGGIALGGRLSEPLLLSLFDASSPGHDGAVVVRGDTVERFAVHLPLSTNHAALSSRGTRHAAALGLAELCDAICLVVSEEHGTVSIARDGQLRTLGLDQLAAALSEPVTTVAAPRVRRGSFLDAGVAVVGAIVAWLIFVPGSDLADAIVPADIEVLNLPSDLELEAIEPAQASVTLRGLRRDLVFANEEGVHVSVDAYLAKFGRRTFSLETAHVSHPDTLAAVNVSPRKLRISLRPRSTGENQK